jgi:hypothetical protein
MIFYWLSPLIIYPMWSNPLRGALAWWSLWTTAFTFAPMYVSGRHGVGFNGDLVEGVTDMEWTLNGRGAMPIFYWAPWIRFQPYLVGILVGYILHRYTSIERVQQLLKTVSSRGKQKYIKDIVTDEG